MSRSYSERANPALATLLLAAGSITNHVQSTKVFMFYVAMLMLFISGFDYINSLDGDEGC